LLSLPEHSPYPRVNRAAACHPHSTRRRPPRQRRRPPWRRHPPNPQRRKAHQLRRLRTHSPRRQAQV